MNLHSLIEKIAKELGLHNSKIQTFCWMILGMINQQDVHHHKLIIDFKSSGTIKSKLERARRFFAYTQIDPIIFSKILIGSVWNSIPKMHLMLDRTNWKFGKQDINYLVLAVRIGRIVFPLFWKMLDHQGNSEQQIRIEHLNMFKEAFGFDCIASFSADREFIGQDWFDFLLKNNIPFFIRIKDNTLVNFGNTKINVRDLLLHLTQNQTRCLYNMFDNNQLFLCCKRINGEFLVICSNVQNSEKVFETYRKRWDIERLFRNKKTQGFNLENTHMQKLERLFLLMFLITVAIFISYMAGVLQKCSYKKTVKAPIAFLQKV